MRSINALFRCAALLIPVAAFSIIPLFSLAAECPNLSRSLSFGSRGQDVVELQNFLIADGHLAAGNNTGYFGSLTQAAVKKFQCEKMQICSGDEASTGWGVVGPRTRSAIAAACGGTNAYSQSSYTSQSGYTAYGQTSYYSQASYASNTSPPTVSITVNNQEDEVVLNMNVIYTLNWSSSNATSCTLTTNFGKSATTQTSVKQNTSGTARSAVVEGGAMYTLSCSNAQGSSEKTSTVIPYGRPCLLDGVTVAHENSATFYKASSVTSPQTCQSVSQSRTCIDATFSGLAEYNKASCKVESASTNTSGAAYAQASYSGGSSGAKSCTYGGQSYAEGQSVSTPGLTVICDNGQWVGPSSDTIPNRTVCLDTSGCNQNTPFGLGPRHGRAQLGVTAYTYVKMGFYICASHTISWGDGATENFPRTENCTMDGATSVRPHAHTYASPGSYSVTFSSEMYTINAVAQVRVDP